MTNNMMNMNLKNQELNEQELQNVAGGYWLVKLDQQPESQQIRYLTVKGLYRF